MKLRKILCLLLCACVALGTIIVPGAAAADNPSYLVKGEVSGNSLTVQVYLQNALAFGGRLAIAYDKDVLEPANTTALNKAVKQASGVTVTTEGHDDSVLIGNGCVMFAWYSTRYAGLDALGSDKMLATITFNLVNGASASDFSRNTMGLYYVNQTMVDGWDSGCEIIANTNGALTAYRNTEVNEAYVCSVAFDYPNCDYVPIVTYNVAVNVKSSADEAIPAAVTLGSVTNTANTSGHTDFEMQTGVYPYRITAQGYETKTGYFIVGEKDETFNAVLRSYSEIAKDIANSLAIGYAEGDSASSVTTDIVLPTESEYGVVTWTSGSSAVTDYGGVRRGDDDTPVTLTATVDVNSATAVKTFDIIVKSRLTAEQKNQAIVSQDKANLEIGFAPGDSANYVTVGLTLPEVGNAGSAISWDSSNESIISYTGTVTRPDYDTTVTLTATIIRGTVYDTKTFTVLVKGVSRPVTPTRTIAPVKTETPVVTVTPVKTEAPIKTPEPVVVVTEAPVIPVKTETPIVTETPVVTEAPIVTEPPAPTEEPEEEFWDVEPTPLVINETLDESNEIVQRILNSLEIGYDKNDTADNVKSAVTLPSVGSEDTQIVWTSSLPAVITPYGGVVRQAEDKEVTLTATITRGNVSEQKTFTLLVKAADEIPENPNNGQEEEIKAKNSRIRNGRLIESKTNENAEGTTSSETSQTGTTNSENNTKKKFVDINDVPWAQEAINTLAERGVINGTSDTTYSPHDNIRRADFVMLLVKLYDLDAEITDTFEDVTEDRYYYSDVSKAKSLGIIAGIDETHFNPEGHISRQDMMTMTYRALKQLNKTSDMSNSNLSAFHDADKVSDYALDSVRHLVGGGYIHGDTDGNLNPLANTTRAETAVFLYGLTR